MPPQNEKRPAGRQPGKALKFKDGRERIYDASNHAASLHQDRHGAWWIGDVRICTARGAARRGRNKIPVAVIRIREIERLIAHRLEVDGVLPGEAELRQAAICLQRISRAKPERLVDLVQLWSDRWTPDESGKIGVIVGEVVGRRQPSADVCGSALSLTVSEREALQIYTIGAVGVTKRDRARIRLEKKRDRERERRRKAGALPREKSVARQVETLGISRSTFYRRMKRETDSCPTVLSITTSGHETVSPQITREVRRAKKAL